MSIQPLIVLAALALAAPSAVSQTKPTATPVGIRTLLQIPVNQAEKFYVPTPAGGREELVIADGRLPLPQSAGVVNGMLSLFASPTVNTEKPTEGLLATTRLPADLRSLILIVIPSPEGSKTPYQMTFLRDAPGEFPWGESRIVNLTSVDFAVEVGEHKIRAPKGDITELPEVKRLNPYKRAQTNFYFQNGDRWTAAAERQLPYLENTRRVFLISHAPKSLSPTVRTVTDLQPIPPRQAAN